VATAGPSAGRGHLGRALAVAEALIANGMRAELVLRAGELSPSQADRARALGIGDAPGRNPAATIVDLPDPNQIAGAPAARLVVFDDAERFSGAAAIVIQPSLPAWRPPAGARAGHVLAGFEYVPIAQAVRAHTEPPGAEGQPPYLVVCFGGSDPDDVTGRIAPALVGLPETRTIVVVGADYRGATSSGDAEQPLDVRRDPADFIGLLAGATLVVGSAGTLKFELAVLGRPMILRAVADDQLATGSAFASTGAARFAGDGRTLPPGAVRSLAAALLADRTERIALGGEARLVTDGRGGDRIARAVAELVGIG